MGIKSVAGGLMLATLFAGCATSTMPGAIGVTRQQLMIVPAAAINDAAAGQYLQLSNAAGQAGKLNSDAALTGRVKGVANRLIREVAVYRPEASSWHWEVNVFEKDDLNAFCAPGGKIGVYSGLIRRLDLSDDELAAVLGHEIAHALREHSREKESQSRLSNAIVQGIANSGSRNASMNSQLVNVGSLLIVRLPFSRQMESEADAMGLELMARAGYDPRLAPNMWRKMQARSSGSSTDFLSTHPSHDRRIEEMEAATPRVVGLYEKSASGHTASSSGVSALPPAATLPTVATSVSRQASTSLALAQTATSPASVALAKVLAAGPLGNHEFQVLRLARERSCPNPIAMFLAKGPGFESYSLSCRTGDSEMLSVRCEFGSCTFAK